MKKYYSVTWHVDATGWDLVEAETAEEAKQLSEEQYCADNDNTELGDAIEIVGVTEMTKEEFDRASR